MQRYIAPKVITDLYSQLICGPDSPYYAMGGAGITTEQKDRIIQAYKTIPNGLGRCPELKGWLDWQQLLPTLQPENGLQPIDKLVQLIHEAGAQNDEGNTANVNEFCRVSAVAQLGEGNFVSAEFIIGSGNKCRITY